MEPIDIGLWVTGGLLVLVVLGMRVAFREAGISLTVCYASSCSLGLL